MADISNIMKTAKQLFKEDYLKAMKNGVLQPSKNKDPISPPITMIEYSAMEQDTAKYFLYYAAIYAELQALQIQRFSCQNTTSVNVNCMIVGGGRGRLVDYCLDCLSELNLKGSVYVIECNVVANEFLKQRYKNNQNVIVLSPMVIRTTDELLLAYDMQICDEVVKTLIQTASIDVFVSELFGSFGDNEFVAEILSVCVNMFGKSNCISIPCSYATYICAIYSSTLQSYFNEHTNSAMYILGLPKDTVVLSNLVKVYEQSCTTAYDDIRANVALTWTNEPSRITGFAGYFRAKLNSNLVIDTTNTDSRNTFFWETAFLPVTNIIFKDDCKEINVSLSRKSRKTAVSRENVLDLKYPLLEVTYMWSVVNDDSDMLSMSGTHKIYL